MYRKEKTGAKTKHIQAYIFEERMRGEVVKRRGVGM